MSLEPLREGLDDELDEELSVDEVPFETFDDEDEDDDVDDVESFLALAFGELFTEDLSDGTDAALAAAREFLRAGLDATTALDSLDVPRLTGLLLAARTGETELGLIGDIDVRLTGDRERIGDLLNGDLLR